MGDYIGGALWGLFRGILGVQSIAHVKFGMKLDSLFFAEILNILYMYQRLFAEVMCQSLRITCTPTGTSTPRITLLDVF